MSPGPQKWLPKLTNARLGASISRFFSFSASVWFWTTLQWFSCFYAFRVSLFQCRRCPRSNKTDSCCSGGSEPHLQHAFTENPSKNDSKKGQVFHTGYVILNRFWSIALFLHPFSQSDVKDIKKDVLMTLFLDFLCESCPKAFKKDNYMDPQRFQNDLRKHILQ